MDWFLKVSGNGTGVCFML